MKISSRRFNPKKFITNFTLVLTLLIAFMSFYNSVAIGSPETLYTEMTVTGGDTLWSIAGEYRDKNTDIRTFIDRIYQANNLSSPVIKPGQVLKIPLL